MAAADITFIGQPMIDIIPVITSGRIISAISKLYIGLKPLNLVILVHHFTIQLQ